MGVTSLLHVISPCLRQVVPTNAITANDIVGVDLSAIVHPLLQRHSQAVLLHGEWSSFDSDGLANLTRLKEWGAKKMIFVADGFRLDGKTANANRAAARQAADKAAIKAFEAGDTPHAADVNTAIGAYAIAGAQRLAAIAKDLGLDVYFAPFETEQQLVLMQKLGLITTICCNDSDYITIGGDNLLLSNCMWSAQCRLFKVKNLAEHVSGGGARGESEADSTLTQRSAKKKKTSENERNANDHFLKLVASHGYPVLLLYSLLVRNDYSHIEGVGVITAMQVVNALFGAAGQPKQLLAAAAEEVVKRVPAGSRAGWACAGDVRKKLETALVMFRSQLVYHPEKKKLVHLHEPKPGMLIQGSVRQLVGWEVMQQVNITKWWNGGYDVATKKLRNPRPSARNGGPAVPLLGGSSSGGGGSSRAAHRLFPSGRPEMLWKVEEVKNFLKAKGINQTGNKGIALVRAQTVYDKPHLVVDLDDVAQITKARGQLDAEMHAKIDEAGWEELTEENAKELLPSLPDSVVRDYKSRLHADTTRLEQIAGQRYVGSVRVNRRPVTTQTIGGAQLKVGEVWVAGEVARSRTTDTRTTLVCLTVMMPTNLVVGISFGSCLFPKGHIDSNGGWRGPKDYKTCRHSGPNSLCSHGAAIFKVVQSPHTVSCTSGARQWGGRAKDIKVDPNQAATAAVQAFTAGDDEDAAPMLSEAIPFSVQHYADMKAKSDMYNEALHRMVAARHVEYDAHYCTANPDMIGRALKVEIVMSPTASQLAAAEAEAAKAQAQANGTLN